MIILFITGITCESHAIKYKTWSQNIKSARLSQWYTVSIPTVSYNRHICWQATTKSFTCYYPIITIINLLLTTSILIAILHVNLGHAHHLSFLSPHFSFSSGSGKDLLETSGTGVLSDGCLSCHPSNSIKALKGTQSITSIRENPIVASSFLHPPLDSWWNRHCCFCTSPPTPVPLPHYNNN